MFFYLPPPSPALLWLTRFDLPLRYPLPPVRYLVYRLAVLSYLSCSIAGLRTYIHYGLSPLLRLVSRTT